MLLSRKDSYSACYVLRLKIGLQMIGMDQKSKATLDTDAVNLLFVAPQALK